MVNLVLSNLLPLLKGGGKPLFMGYKEKQVLKVAWLSLFLFFFPALISAQSSVVTGNITDNTGEAVIGANVLVKGTTTGVISDFDGNFSLQVPDLKTAVLQISFIGYAPQEIALKGKTSIKVVLKEDSEMLEEVTIVAYGTQKKETLTGAISSVKTDALLASPNASVANSLSGKIPGLASVQTSGQPGAEDPKLFIRGAGALTESGSSPLILVDGVERSFFQMDPNEIADITVLKDASATAVFGVRGANGVILVTTRRGEKGKAKVSVSSSVGVQMPTRMLRGADSYTYAKLFREREANDGRDPDRYFTEYDLERFRLGDDPLMYPSIDWREYMLKNSAIQTQHNLNISGGTDNVRYFISAGYLFQDGLFNDFGNESEGYNYRRFNYRSNLDIDLSKSTTLKVGIGGVVGDRKQSSESEQTIWRSINNSQPFSSPGVIDGNYIVIPNKYGDIKHENPLGRIYNRGYMSYIKNTLNMDLNLTQKLDFITKGLSAEVKGAYNTSYDFNKGMVRPATGLRTYYAYYQSELEDPEMLPTDPNYNKNVVYLVDGIEEKLQYNETNGRARNWYFEASLRYARKFGSHNLTGLLLYNQSKKYYPSQYNFIPTAYVGLVGRITYDYKSRYLAEFNIGYNGSENFAPDKRFGTFPAVSLGYILSEEKFMKNIKFFDFFKLRATVGLVGNDNMSNNRFLYLPDTYNIDKTGIDSEWKQNIWGYNFGKDNTTILPGALESRIGNRNVTWETSLKQNYGLDMKFLNNRMKVTFDYFIENRRDILIARQTIPAITAFTSSLLPVVNLGEVENKGYEVELGWNDQIGDNLRYYINANVSYAKNKIIYQDEVEPNEPYLWRTGKQVGAVFGYVSDGFYTDNDFDITIDEDGNKIYNLKEGLPVPQINPLPGDIKYKDLNNDKVVDTDDQCEIGFSSRPNYTFGLNYGLDYKGLFFSMNWSGTAERSVVLSGQFSTPFSGTLMEYQTEGIWRPETAETATMPRLSKDHESYNYQRSDLWVRNGSYLKLKNLTIGYRFTNKAALKKIGISQLGIKFTGYNLLTFDHLKIMDPESNPDWYNDRYPVVKIYNIGLDITF